MTKKRFGSEQIVTLLRQIEVSMGQGKSTPIACHEAGISEQSYYRWRKEYGGIPPAPLEAARVRSANSGTMATAE